MSTERTSRSQATRETDVRAASTWRPANDLPNPNPRPGWGHRWIRTSFMDKQDPKNVSTAIREGWEPVLASDYPEINLAFDSRAASDSKNGNVEIGGLILCRRPEEVNTQRDDYYHDLTTKQTLAVDNDYMRENDHRMPKFSENRSSVSFGRSR